MKQYPHRPNQIYENVSEMLKSDHDDMYIHENNVMQVVEEKHIKGDNEKYLALYDKIAPLYRMSNAVYFIWKFGGERNYRNEFLTELEWKRGDKVLETSVGTGDNFRYLPNDMTLFGLDLSRGMLKQAAKNMRKWKRDAYLFQGNAEQLPFKDNCFDVVFHVGGINFFTDKETAILEMIRVAKHGTKIMIVDETEKLVTSTYKKTPITKEYYETANKISAPVDLIPNEMQDIQYKEVCDGLMYCLTFRKP